MRGPRFDIYPDENGGWRWRLHAANGRAVADGSEAHSTLESAQRAVERVRVLMVGPAAMGKGRLKWTDVE